MNKKYSKYQILALEALVHYDIKYTHVSFLIEETNIFFLVETNQKKYVLKIFQEASSKIEDNLIEAILLKEVSKNTNIIVPNIVPSKSNQEILFVNSSVFDIPKRVALYHFVEGIDFDQQETDELFKELGRKMAQIHTVTKHIILPDNLKPKRWDKVFYYRDEEILYHQKKYQKFFLTEDIQFLDRFQLFLEKELPKYYQDEVYLLHADLNPWNIKLHHNEMRILDFEEGMIGTVVHEMAICLFYYRYDLKYDYKHIQTLLFEGYSELSSLPKISLYDIDLLIMARTHNFVNYVLLLEDDPTNYIQERIKRMRDFTLHYNITL